MLGTKGQPLAGVVVLGVEQIRNGTQAERVDLMGRRQAGTFKQRPANVGRAAKPVVEIGIRR
jgi:hypothetical protein